ncbi:uncharacterized protein A1O5_00803 [Cladophialophora psammophila CBS 110553]|uniref:Laccase n=1 Tax=Cladophialophora psammophila CBS 110553 TaxID=1182543 RepID=W9XG14_9EURO|nr:uncharacterized protein A1O5_00803 [Cladophialophora psammophila CBS 110553]EXJ76295.1 hypothetical protein A1O5_00803 [Cladophialophora psammophila CBS 110553]
MNLFTAFLVYLGILHPDPSPLRVPSHGEHLVPNVTQPFQPLRETRCNSPLTRSDWCDGFSIDTDSDEDGPTTGNICEYSFIITNTTKDFDGVERLALAVNGHTPGPTIECQWGDVLRVNVTNLLPNNQTAMHWHGLSQRGGATNDQDGVPGVTECAIPPGHSRTYEFKLKQFGTAWWHSHALSQFGDGIRGPIIIHGPATSNYDIDMGAIMIDNLFDNSSNPISTPAYASRVLHVNGTAFYNYILNGANKSPNLKRGKHALWSVKPGKKHLFRIINSAIQSAWAVHFDNHKMTVIAADLVPIKPYTTEWLNIGNGQRYDVVVEMDQPADAYFLRAVAQLGCPDEGENNGLGHANGIFRYEDAPLKLPSSSAGNKTITDFFYCADEPLASLVPWIEKSAGSRTAFEATASTLPSGDRKRVTFSDDGTVWRWPLNLETITVNYTQPTLKLLADGISPYDKPIEQQIVLPYKDQWVYFVIQNQFYAAHPMHLHGHDMAILGQGHDEWNPSLISTLNFENPPRRDTALVVGNVAKDPNVGGYLVLGFKTDNPGVWMLHCHIIWHSESGMGLQFIERPNEIPAKVYTSKASFKGECAAEVAYEAEDPSHIKSGSISGV